MSVVAWGTPTGRGVVAAASLGSGLTLLDGTVVNVALRTIGADLLPEPLVRIAHAMSYPSMLLALVIATLLFAGMALATVARPQSPAALWALLTLEALMGINAVAHAASAWLVLGGYGPGLVTAVLLNAPFAAYCFRLAHRDRWLGRTALLSTLPAALVLHGPVLLGALWLLAR